MKLNGLFIVALVFVTGIAHAQSSKKKIKVEAPVAAPVLASQGTETAGTNTAVVEKDKPVRNNFGVTWYFIGGQTLSNQTDQLSSFDVFDSYLSFNYKISEDFKISARPAFGYALQGTTNVGKETNDRSRVRDFSFVAGFSNLFQESLPASMSYKLAPRLYLPTSDGSKEEGMIARLRMEQSLRWAFGQYSDVTFYAKPAYYFQRTTTYLNSSGKIRTSKLADSEHGAELSYSLSKMFAVKPALNFIESWSNSSSANNQATFRSSALDYRIGLEIRAIKDLSFTLGLQREQDLLAKKDDEMSYSLLTGGTLF
ncbi:hypothetical protein CIK05_10050 [Bdellovibrio sp. qaytius]|nr:hypothetical protein CIK05_10050 [Bdellovibrio sp. qaytius]